MKVYEGQQVLCNGYPGTITKICSGAIDGMVEVRLERGTVCVSIEGHNLLPYSPKQATTLSK